MKFRFEGKEFIIYSFATGKVKEEECLTYLPEHLLLGLQNTSSEFWPLFVRDSLGNENVEFKSIIEYFHAMLAYKGYFPTFYYKVLDFIYNGFTPLDKTFYKFSLKKGFSTCIKPDLKSELLDTVNTKFYIDIKIKDPHLQTLFALRFPNLKIVE